MTTLDEIAQEAALKAFPNDTVTSSTLRMIFAEGFKSGHAVGFAEAANRDFGSGFREWVENGS